MLISRQSFSLINRRSIAAALIVLVSTACLQTANAAGNTAIKMSIANSNTAVITGHGFPARKTVSLTLLSSTMRFRTAATAESNGQFATRIVSPSKFSGVLRATATSGSVSASAGIRIASPSQVPMKKPAPMPISPAGYLGNYNLSSTDYAIANRFVLAKNTKIDRWYFAVNAEGADCVGGREGYGYGNGGIFYGRIVEVNPSTGLPTTHVLASEKINGCDSWKRAKDEFGLDQLHESQFIQFPPITLKGNVMYAMVLSNVDANPGGGGDGETGNNMSPNLDFAKVSEMGPNGRNTLDAKATGAIAGLDPRETVMWSENGGKTWSFGAAVGWYDNDNGLGKTWPSGYRIAGGANVPHGWPYMNWPDDSQATITITATTALKLTVAGAANSKDNVGTITVRNLSTNASASTPSLGTGMVRGKLSKPIAVAAGQQYSVSSEGPVGIGSDDFGRDIFNLGKTTFATYKSDCSTCSNDSFRPMLYAQ